MSDYIKREDVLNVLDKLCDIVCQYSKKQRSVMCCACNLGSTFDVIEEVTAADVVERKAGKWEEVDVIYVDVDDEEHAFDAIASMRCSECNRYHNEVFRYGNPTEMAHYCPNCGARMVNYDS